MSTSLSTALQKLTEVQQTFPPAVLNNRLLTKWLIEAATEIHALKARVDELEAGR